MTISEEIDLGTAHVVRRTIEHASLARDTRLILDMAAVTFIDSTGLGAFVAIQRIGNQHDIEVFLASPSRKVVAVLQLAGLTPYFPVWSDDTVTGTAITAG